MSFTCYAHVWLGLRPTAEREQPALDDTNDSAAQAYDGRFGLAGPMFPSPWWCRRHRDDIKRLATMGARNPNRCICG